MHMYVFLDSKYGSNEPVKEFVVSECSKIRQIFKYASGTRTTFNILFH